MGGGKTHNIFTNFFIESFPPRLLSIWQLKGSSTLSWMWTWLILKSSRQQAGVLKKSTIIGAVQKFAKLLFCCYCCWTLVSSSGVQFSNFPLLAILSMRKFPSHQQEAMQINSVSKQTHLRFQSIGRRTHRVCVNTLLSGWWHPITTTTENSTKQGGRRLFFSSFSRQLGSEKVQNKCWFIFWVWCRD